MTEHEFGKFKFGEELLVFAIWQTVLPERFEVTWPRDDDNKGATVEIQLLDQANCKRLKLGFTGVTGIMRGDVSFNWYSCYLMIRDIRDRQWDSLSYEVFDTEDEWFRFYCHDYTLIEEDA